jgi:dihydrodipicolinate synthase/N-acetylneuraminate lyase
MSVAENRKELLKKLTGGEPPRLWCPPLTHYRSDGCLDLMRIEAHWRSVLPHVCSFLVPGSTGDAWEMLQDEIVQLLDFSMELVGTLEARMLVGMLKPESRQSVEGMVKIMEGVKRRTGEDDEIDALAAAGITGFTVTAPHGEDISREKIKAGLEAVLDTGLPVALYQLPQVTGNEIAPETFEDLAAAYANLIMFKDSSGADKVALADNGRSGVFLMRGAEGDYARWARETGGPYNGWLLSTGNCFGRQLAEIRDSLAGNMFSDARGKSDRLTRVIEKLFALVAGLPAGNPFANAGKAADHYMAHGPDALDVEPPMLHAGERLPREVIEEAGKILKDADMLPDKGYLEG